jgi:hypothetical protein
MNPADLERFAARELERLRPPRAPHTLLPRVMASIQAWSSRPWYERAWFKWPLPAQVVSIAVLTLLVAGAIRLLPHVEAGADRAASMLAADVLGSASGMAASTASAAAAARVVWRATIQPLAPYAFALVVLMCLACGLFGAALNHLAFGRMLQR